MSNKGAATLMSMKGSKGIGKGLGKGKTCTAIVPHVDQPQDMRQCDCCRKVDSSRDPGSNHNQHLPFVKDMACVYCFVYWSQMFSWMEWKAASEVCA